MEVYEYLSVFTLLVLWIATRPMKQEFCLDFWDEELSLYTVVMITKFLLLYT